MTHTKVEHTAIDEETEMLQGARESKDLKWPSGYTARLVPATKKKSGGFGLI